MINSRLLGVCTYVYTLGLYYEILLGFSSHNTALVCFPLPVYCAHTQCSPSSMYLFIRFFTSPKNTSRSRFLYPPLPLHPILTHSGCNILSLSSSGPYCIVQLQTLQQIEAQSGYKITKLFHWVVACGFGALFLLLIIYGTTLLHSWLTCWLWVLSFIASIYAPVYNVFSCVISTSHSHKLMSYIHIPEGKKNSLLSFA